MVRFVPDAVTHTFYLDQDMSDLTDFHLEVVSQLVLVVIEEKVHLLVKVKVTVYLQYF